MCIGIGGGRNSLDHHSEAILEAAAAPPTRQAVSTGAEGRRATVMTSRAPLVDFAECPPAIDDRGRATWPQIVALQAHVVVSRLLADIRALEAEHSRCNTCGAQPCVNPSLCAACQAAGWRPRRR